MLNQMSLITIESNISKRSHTAIGALGERAAAILLEKAGYAVSFTNQRQAGDLKAINTETGETYTIEVKTARRCSDRKWRFTLAKTGHTDHRHADFVILMCALKSGRMIPFVIPISELENQRAAVISSHPEDYSGKFSIYRQKAGSIRLGGL